MLKLLQLLIFGHCHKWEIIKAVECDNKNNTTWTRHYCQCEKCGRVKIFDV